MSIMDSIAGFNHTSIIPLVQITPEVDYKSVVTPGSRSSSPDYGGNTDVTNQVLYGEVVQAGYQFEVIPLIRKLVIANADVSQALGNVVNLGNTGHKIVFDRSVPEELAEEMNMEIERAMEKWAEQVPGKDGLVNKMFAQVMIAGALSNEWVPALDLSEGIRRVVMVNPENIRFKYNRKKLTYDSYQRPTNSYLANLEGLKKLNPVTYKYYALNGDTDSPYGNPPYLPALGPIEIQRGMLDNIKFLIKQVGVMGFLEFLSEKPAQKEGSTDAQYAVQLNSYLDEALVRVKKGMRDGIVVGFKDDHEFEFHSITKNVEGVETLFRQNETQVASGLKQDASLLGRDYGTSETQITVVFNKMLSELTNIQNVVKVNLEYGYRMHLRLRGYKFKHLKVKFNRSTLQDEYKFQQAQEIKIRNLNALYWDGVISLDTYAREMDIDKPDQKKPRAMRGITASQDPSTEAAKKKGREADKDKSDRKVRDSNKPRGTTKQK